LDWSLRSLLDRRLRRLFDRFALKRSLSERYAEPASRRFSGRRPRSDSEGEARCGLTV
jgi:hypothetical protein